MATDGGPVPDVTGVVLAGGGSTRFSGGDKALAALRGEALIERVADAVRAATGRPPVVGVRTTERREVYETVLGDVTFARDDPAFDGPLAGVVGALDAVATPWLFVCGADMPLLSADAIRWLAGRRRDDDDAVAPRHPDGTRDPMHTLYRRDAVADARDRLPRSGGVRALLAALDRVQAVPVGAAPPDAGLADSLANVNTRAELDAIRERE